MNHDQKAEEVLMEILFENWMTVDEWRSFIKNAKKKAGYCAKYLADDIASTLKTNDLIDSRIEQMQSFKKTHFAL